MNLSEVIQLIFGIAIMVLQVLFSLAFMVVVIAGLFKIFFGS